jgi:hypothetical protein
MHESPVRRAAPQHPEVDVNGSNGPFMLVGAEIVWQDRCDAANGSKEPILQNAAPGLNGREARKAGIAWQRRPFADFRQLIR